MQCSNKLLDLRLAKKSSEDKAVKLAQWYHIQADCPLLPEFMQGMQAKTLEWFGPNKKGIKAVATFNTGKAVVTGEFTPARKYHDGKLRAVR